MKEHDKKFIEEEIKQRIVILGIVGTLLYKKQSKSQEDADFMIILKKTVGISRIIYLIAFSNMVIW